MHMMQQVSFAIALCALLIVPTSAFSSCALPALRYAVVEVVGARMWTDICSELVECYQHENDQWKPAFTTHAFVHMNCRMGGVREGEALAANRGVMSSRRTFAAVILSNTNKSVPEHACNDMIGVCTLFLI